MAYDELLSERIASLIKSNKSFTRKEMFGGVGYLYNGHMCVGVHKNDLIIRYDPALTEKLASNKNVKPFTVAGRPMKGWSLVSGHAINGRELEKWVDLSFQFVKSLPPK